MLTLPFLTGKIARQQREQNGPAVCFSITTCTNGGLHNIIPTSKALFYYYRKVVVEQASKLEKARAASLADSRMVDSHLHDGLLFVPIIPRFLMHILNPF
ncbi:uncharacterized protein AKAW2_70657A [Aspergillus luchuensis]|uniref:Uncharacterized protein n=1 Tax=Aspergillus kawachii TaxID=1069201 RepID=A0A7R7WJR6_ASPKA|nr:uncharacterized protein AKAW2_70657A [Aspergillus luchuensis]BCS03779.1 hypothetical protein AKAW2_70657A [Aspergillus luchuensis]